MFRTRIILASLLLVLALPACAQAEENKSRSNADVSETYRQLNLFGEVFERVRQEYVEKPDDEKLIAAALNGMLSSLDPHSSYLDKKAFQDMQVQTKGEFGGLGIEVTMENGLVKVVSPIDDTPAYKAGFKPNDLIVGIDDEPVMGLTLAQAVEKMRGPAGSRIKLLVKREGIADPFDVKLTRAVIRIQSVRSRIEANDIGYIRITAFNDKTEQGLEKAIADIQKKLGDKVVGYVLDLRNNPGGLLEQSIFVADSFLDKGDIVSTRGRPEETASGQEKPAREDRVYAATKGDLIKGKPLVVLINGGSASASEIVAGALQDNRRAIVMGTPTFGKGSVQTVIPVMPYGALRITTARYYTPSGRSIQAKGITPDIEVQPAHVEEIKPGLIRHEADLRGALKNDTEPAEPEKTPAPQEKGDSKKSDDSKEKSKDDSSRSDTGDYDYQLARALDLLHGLNLYKMNQE